MRRARSIRVELGGEDTLFGPFPPRPKRMRLVAYARMFAEYKAAVAEAFELTRREAFSLWRKVEALTPPRGAGAPDRAEPRLLHL